VAGKELAKKDLGMQVMTYGNVYVARVALWAKINHVTRVFLEADSYHGTSLIIAHAPCIAHGYDLRRGIEQQKLTVNSGVWPLYRFDPRRIDEGKPPLELDSRDPTVGVRDYLQNESRFRMVEAVDPDRYERLVAAHQRETTRRFAVYKQLAGISFPLDAREEEEEELASPSLVEARAS
jgi:pyruvate-ferredoxin/flavodoxin oxidoreductase